MSHDRQRLLPEVLNELPMEFAVEAQRLLASAWKEVWADAARQQTSPPRLAQADSARASTSMSRRRSARDHGPNGSGKSTLAHALAGREGYDVTGTVTLDGARPAATMDPTRAPPPVCSWAFQYPVEIPGVNNMYFLAPRSTRCAHAGRDRSRARRVPSKPRKRQWISSR